MPGQGLKETVVKKQNGVFNTGERGERLYRFTVKDIYGEDHTFILNEEETVLLEDNINVLVHE